MIEMMATSAALPICFGETGGSLLAAALLGSVPVVILYSFFVEYCVSSLTGAVKE